MNYSKFRFTLDMHKHQSQVSVPVMRGDTAVQLYITLSDGGHPYEIGGSCFAILIGNKPNQPPFRHPCLIEGNVIRYDFTSETTALSGSVACEIVLYGTNGIVTAPCFTIVVDERISHHDGDISAEDEAALDRLIMAALNNERSVRNITSIDSIYESVDELPTDVGNGTTYVVINDDEKALYAFSDGVKAWIKIHDLQPHVAYIILTGRRAGIYRYTMASPYLVSAESHTLEDAKEYTDAEIAKVYEHIEGLGTGGGVPDLTDLTDRVEAIASSVGDIDTALDAIIAIQESLIGGDTE